MRECRTYGSVRGVGGNAHPYRDSVGALEHGMIKQNRRAAVEQVDVRLCAREADSWRTVKLKYAESSIMTLAYQTSFMGQGAQCNYWR